MTPFNSKIVKFLISKIFKSYLQVIIIDLHFESIIIIVKVWI
jgi:hypothetical protein